MIRIHWRRLLVVAIATPAAVALLGWLYWLGFDLDRVIPANPAATPSSLPFLGTPDGRHGRILAVVSSAATIGDGSRRGGYELTELARAYYVFMANGFNVDIASPAGGRPLAVIDDDLLDVDHAFLNDPRAQHQVEHSLPLAEVDPTAYAAVYFVGGKGAMVDFPEHPEIARIVHDIRSRGGVVGAVCHGPAALLGLRDDDGRPLIAGRRLSGFTNAEELFLIEDAHDVFGTLLQDRLQSAGARFVEAPMYLDNTVVDGWLVTGQNPWSTWSTAEAMVHALGHQPVPREPTAEEQAVQVLATYRANGYDAARAARQQRPGADMRLVLMHAVVAAMNGSWHHAFQLQRLAHGRV